MEINFHSLTDHLSSNAGYLRGVTHGLEIAWMLMETHNIGGAFRADMVSACNTAMEFRTDHKPHPALLDELMKAIRIKRNEQADDD